MPIYEYRCAQCYHDFDVRRSFGDDSSATCPSCQSEARRIFSPVPIIFKGSGFYVTDHRTEPASEIGDSVSTTESSSTQD